MSGRLVRLGNVAGSQLRLTVDGRSVAAHTGDSVLAAVLAEGPLLRRSEFGGEARAGFCLMGACQDCWMWTETGERLRACTTAAQEGMRLATTPPDEWADA